MLCSFTLSWRSPYYQSIDLLCKSMDWFLYDRDLYHDKVHDIVSIVEDCHCPSLFNWINWHQFLKKNLFKNLTLLTNSEWYKKQQKTTAKYCTCNTIYVNRLFCDVYCSTRGQPYSTKISISWDIRIIL